MAGDLRGGFVFDAVAEGASVTTILLALPDRYLALVMPFLRVADVTRPTVLLGSSGTAVRESSFLGIDGGFLALASFFSSPSSSLGRPLMRSMSISSSSA